MRARLERFQQRTGQEATRLEEALQEESASRWPLRALRSLYAEGEVTVEMDGRRFARAAEVYFSPADDRMVLNQASVTVVAAGGPGASGEFPLVIDSERVVRQGDRIQSRDASLTTCDAGEPHFKIRSEWIEVTWIDTRGWPSRSGRRRWCPSPRCRPPP
jgi:hypothetical protein